MARVGTASLRVAFLHHLYHEKEGAAMLQAKTPPPGYSSRGYAPMQPSVWILLDSTNWDILREAKDIYHGQYQLALTILTCQHHDLSMQDLHEELGWWLGRVRVGLHNTMHTAQWHEWIATCSRMSQSKGRVYSHVPPLVPSSSWTWLPSPETSRHEGTTAPQWCGPSTVHPSWAQSTGPTQSWECLHTPPRVKE